MTTNNNWYSINNSEVKLGAEQLREISQDISECFAPDKDHPTPELVALPVDPYHLYAYWNMDRTNMATIKSNVEQETLTLRVFWRPEGTESLEGNKLWFDVPIEQQQHHSKVRLPVDQTVYSCSVGWRNVNARFNPIVSSNLIHVPRARMGADPQSIMKLPKVQTTLDISTVHPIKNNRADELQTYDEQEVDQKIRQTLVGKGQQASTLDFRFNVQKTIDNRIAENSYDEVLVDYQIKQTLNQKGIQIDHLDQTIITTKSAVSDSDGWSNNPSGQNSSC